MKPSVRKPPQIAVLVSAYREFEDFCRITGLRTQSRRVMTLHDLQGWTPKYYIKYRTWFGSAEDFRNKLRYLISTGSIEIKLDTINFISTFKKG